MEGWGDVPGQSQCLAKRESKERGTTGTQRKETLVGSVCQEVCLPICRLPSSRQQLPVSTRSAVGSFQGQCPGKVTMDPSWHLPFSISLIPPAPTSFLFSVFTGSFSALISSDLLLADNNRNKEQHRFWHVCAPPPLNLLSKKENGKKKVFCLLPASIVSEEKRN